MSQKGTHTWDLILQYHRCPQCGFINENRQEFKYVMGKYLKEASCQRCGHEWILTKPVHPSFGPLIGEAQPLETEWGS